MNGCCDVKGHRYLPRCLLSIACWLEKIKNPACWSLEERRREMGSDEDGERRDRDALHRSPSRYKRLLGSSLEMTGPELKWEEKLTKVPGGGG